jgi:hypothetical protein
VSSPHTFFALFLPVVGQSAGDLKCLQLGIRENLLFWAPDVATIRISLISWMRMSTHLARIPWMRMSTHLATPLRVGMCPTAVWPPPRNLEQNFFGGRKRAKKKSVEGDNPHYFEFASVELTRSSFPIDSHRGRQRNRRRN